MHPDIVHKLETLHDNVQHNMPVEKDLVFELVPELFSFEMRKLTTEQQLDYKGRQYEYLRADGVQNDIDERDNQMMHDESEYLVDKIKEMEMYMLQESQELTMMYLPDIEKAINDKGHANIAAYLYHLEMRTDENREPWEK